MVQTRYYITGHITQHTIHYLLYNSTIYNTLLLLLLLHCYFYCWLPLAASSSGVGDHSSTNLIEGGGWKRSSSPPSACPITWEGPASDSTGCMGSLGCSCEYNTCTSSCNVLQYVCNSSTAMLSSVIRAWALASLAHANERDWTTQSSAKSRSASWSCRWRTSLRNSFIRSPSPIHIAVLRRSSAWSLLTSASRSPIGSLLPLLLSTSRGASWCRGTPMGPVDLRAVFLCAAAFL
jgi:hypothetical protein